jgi:hypothetical protein
MLSPHFYLVCLGRKVLMTNIITTPVKIYLTVGFSILLDFDAVFADADVDAFWFGFFVINIETETDDDHEESANNEVEIVGACHAFTPYARISA